MIYVDSSNVINSYGWENDNLYIDFVHGKSRTFKNVPESVFREMTRADSVGSYFYANIYKKYDE